MWDVSENHAGSRKLDEKLSRAPSRHRRVDSATAAGGAELMKQCFVVGLPVDFNDAAIALGRHNKVETSASADVDFRLRTKKAPESLRDSV